MSSNRTSNRTAFSSNHSTPWSSSLPSTDDEYITRMIANAEIIDGTLYPTEVDEKEMEETLRELAEQNERDDEESVDGEGKEHGGKEGAGADEEALHGTGWMFWNVLGVVGAVVVALMVYKCRK